MFTGGVSSLEVCLHWRCVFTGGVSSLEVCLLLQGMACFYVSFKKNNIYCLFCFIIMIIFYVIIWGICCSFVCVCVCM